MHTVSSMALGLLAVSSTAVAVQCGNSRPSFEHRALSEQMQQRHSKRAQTDRGHISVNTYVHVVGAGDTPSEGYYGDEIVEREIDHLNSAYAEHDISFKLIETTRTVNASWASPDGSPVEPSTEPDMKRALRRGTYADLNLYMVPYLVPGGRCELPFVDPTSEIILDDGCLVGHWFGLFHTFDHGCDKPGDFVDDTPAEAYPSVGDSYDTCPAQGRNTCPDLPGLDPIDNYMTYVLYGCNPQKFTPGQADRMHNLWRETRYPFVGSNSTIASAQKIVRPAAGEL